MLSRVVSSQSKRLVSPFCRPVLLRRYTLSPLIPRRNLNAAAEQQHQQLQPQHSSVVEDEPWLAIIGGGIVSFAGLYWLAGLEAESNKREMEDALERPDADYEGPSSPTRKGTAKKFSAF